MKKFLIAALMVASFATAQAQQPVGTLSIQPKVGFNLASLTKFDDTSMRAAVVTGAEGMYQVSDIFGLSAGLLYSQQGVEFDGDAAYNVEFEYDGAAVPTQWDHAINWGIVSVANDLGIANFDEAKLKMYISE